MTEMDTDFDLDLEENLVCLDMLKQAFNKLKRELDLQTEVVSVMLRDREKKVAYADGRRFTLVEAQRTTVDEEGLRTAIGLRAFNKLTERKFSVKKAEAALEKGDLDPELIAKYAVTVTNKASIRISDDLPDE